MFAAVNENSVFFNLALAIRDLKSLLPNLPADGETIEVRCLQNFSPFCFSNASFCFNRSGEAQQGLSYFSPSLLLLEQSDSFPNWFLCRFVIRLLLFILFLRRELRDRLFGWEGRASEVRNLDRKGDGWENEKTDCSRGRKRLIVSLSYLSPVGLWSFYVPKLLFFCLSGEWSLFN